MKFLRILVLAGLLMLASVAASAQELTETTTLGPITVQHPANFVVEAVSGGVGLIDDTDKFAILIFPADSLAEMGLPEAATASDFLNTMTELEALTGDPSPISLAGAEGFVVEGVIPEVGNSGVIYALDGENGLIVALVIAREGDVTEEFRELGESIIDSVVVDPSAVAAVETDVPAGTDAPEATPEGDATDEPTGEVDSEADSEAADQIFDTMRALNTAYGVTIVIVTHDYAVSKRVSRVVGMRDGRASIEVLRQKDGAGVPLTEEEFTVLDRTGRLQLPQGYIEQLGMRSLVRLHLDDDHIAVYPAEQDN